MSNLSKKIEALLFALGRPLSRADLSKMLGVQAEELEQGIAELVANLRGIMVVDDGKVLELRISGDAAQVVEKARKEEYSRDIGRAGLEALAVVLYRGASTRAEIDFVRGVNSTQTLRTLTMRGLVRKIPNPKDERSFLYEPTTELLAQMGLPNIHELPEYKEVQEKLANLEQNYRNVQSQPTDLS